jgi:hypothetical protein
VGYEVEIDWLGRRLARLPARTRGRIAWTREGRARRRARREDGDRWWAGVLDLGTGWGDGGWGAFLGVLTLLTLAVGFLWWLGVVAVVLALIELAILVPLLLLAFLGRAVLRRPWRVLVRSGEGAVRAAADVRGYRAARRLRDSWAAELHGGRPPHHLEIPPVVPGILRPDLLDDEAPDGERPDGQRPGEVRPDEVAG